eukprot:TRINITY_DN2344_c0_g2_i1.p1 TRINITY_DN2344_c0_g2~~TRINITY_DN2344_c0_g2_i1.p1  ORF type:complete len:635 (+),score=155.49 TRINITY_DN2344_c0_g2_i1:91-1905(+)
MALPRQAYAASSAFPAIGHLPNRLPSSGHVLCARAPLAKHLGGSTPGAAQLARALQLLTGQLYLLPNVHAPPRDTQEAIFLHADGMLHYEPFFQDFGPYNLGMLKRFVVALDDRLKRAEPDSKKVYVTCGADARTRTNVACVCASYLVLRRGFDASKAAETVAPMHTVPFHDASTGLDTFQLRIPDVVGGLAKAVGLGWYNVDNFNVQEYEHYEQIENGDFNWIVPGKLLAFSGPSGPHTRFTPDMYVHLFRKIGVNCVVRLNERRYNRTVFVQAGIRHFDFLFPDGSNPPDGILRKFLALAEEAGAVVAVHCKAGLGRTGTLIAAYLMKHHRFTAAEAIGWIRLCRPGSIIGPQQHYLADMQAVLWRAGEDHRNVPPQLLPSGSPKAASQPTPPYFPPLATASPASPPTAAPSTSPAVQNIVMPAGAPGSRPPSSPPPQPTQRPPVPAPTQRRSSGDANATGLTQRRSSGDANASGQRRGSGDSGASAAPGTTAATTGPRGATPANGSGGRALFAARRLSTAGGIRPFLSPEPRSDSGHKAPFSSTAPNSDPPARGSAGGGPPLLSREPLRGSAGSGLRGSTAAAPFGRMAAVTGVGAPRRLW